MSGRQPATTTDPYWTADTLLEAFQRMVRKRDEWRAYVGDDLTDDEAWSLLQEARDALARAHRFKQHE